MTLRVTPNGAFGDKPGNDLSTTINSLGRRAWGTKKSSMQELYLEPYQLADKVNFESIMKIYLDHARRVAPGIEVPIMIPPIQVSPLVGAAGQFVEENGWVKIVLSPTFASKPSAVQAILCHEVCHYILGSNGIRAAGIEENERLTDVAMFVLGLGRVFLAGYREHGRIEYRTGHRLGYLTDVEYRYVEREAVRVRSAGNLLLSEEALLLGRLRNRLGGDDQKVRRYLESAQRKYPEKREDERIRDILFELERL